MSILSLRSWRCLAVIIATITAQTGFASSPSGAPIQIKSAPKIDLSKPDGGLAPVAGVENIAVFRASRAAPDRAEGKGYTYNHHPDIAVWHGRLYVAWDSGQKDEDTWPARELYSTSVNGRDWSKPAELFPQGTSTPTRLYFFLAPNGRMLAFAGMRVSHAKTEETRKGPIVVREIHPDHTLGTVYIVRPPIDTALPPNAPPLYTESSDQHFIQACEQLLNAHVTLETQDNGVFLDPDQRIAWHNAKAWPDGKIGRGFWKAPSFFHRADGTLVGIGKNGWTTTSTDGVNWTQPVVPPTLVTNNAKVWGQRTPDGHYALVYNPTLRPRYPLAIVSGADGVTFGDMRAVQAHFPPQRYPGLNKNTGLQYVRGVAEWDNDGSVADTQHAMWIVYSANKEDIWVSRIPTPIAAIGSGWNTYQPKWATVTTTPTGATIESREPFDCAEATRLITPSPRVTADLTLTTPASGLGAVDVALVGDTGGAVPVRLRFAGDGFLRALDGMKMVEYGRFDPGATVTLHLTADGTRHRFTVTVNGGKPTEAQFAESCASLARLRIRVWARADGDRPFDPTPATASVGPEFDQPAPSVTTRVTGVTFD
ncbi:MAG TPA: hypothetical protein VHE61_05685 [Opitutaceae bacterium]|nr:hypothetical protein [Opitutaceae bacterium]